MPKNTFFNLTNDKQNRIIEASINEFSSNSYDTVKIANIIKEAAIPRGSFYQYFEDKKDLLQYLLEYAGKKKLAYMSDVLQNPRDVPFLTLFKELYLSGMNFSIDYPKLSQIGVNLIHDKGSIFEEIIKPSYEQAKIMYYEMIERDKSKGRIREDIDSMILASIVRDATVNITINSIDKDSKKFDYDTILERINQIITIFEFGVKKGDYDV